LLAAGAGGAASSAGQGRIVFASFMPEYPLPNNFQVERTFVVGAGGARHELPLGAVLSPDGSRVAEVRAGSELWVSRAGGARPRRIVVADAPISDVAWSNNGTRLAFVAGGVWVAGADGTGLREIFAPAGEKISLPSYAVWAPDDRHVLAFAGEDAWLVASDGSAQVKIFEPATSPPWAGEGVTQIAWAPVTSRLVLTIGTAAGCGPGFYENCVDWYGITFDAAGKRLAVIPSALDFAWSPNGTKLAYEQGLFLLEPETVQIYTATATGAHPRDLMRAVTKLGKDDCWQYPSWVDDAAVAVEENADCQPDYVDEVGFVVARARTGAVVFRSRGWEETFPSRGRSLAFLKSVHGLSTLFTVDLGAAHPRATRIAAPADLPRWSPDGRRLAFTLFGSRYRYLAVLARGSGRIRHAERLKADRTLTPWWYGSRLVYSSSLPLSSRPRLWSVRPDGTGLHRLQNGLGALDPSWSPDGSRLVFAPDGVAVATMRPDGSGLRRVTAGKRQWYMNPSWSPDGKTIVYGHTPGVVFTIPADGHGTPRRLTPKGESTDFLSSQAWSPDGEKIAYASEGDVGVMNADGSGRTTLVHSCCSAPAWSPDGSKLAFYCFQCADGKGGIGVVDADGSDVRVVVGDLRGTGPYPNLQAPAWSPDGGELVFSGTSCTHDADPAQGPPAICVVSLDGSGLRALTPPGVGAFAPSWTAAS
jgi:Tol biopolymer transport system component